MYAGLWLRPRRLPECCALAGCGKPAAPSSRHRRAMNSSPDKPTAKKSRRSAKELRRQQFSLQQSLQQPTGQSRAVLQLGDRRALVKGSLRSRTMQPALYFRASKRLWQLCCRQMCRSWHSLRPLQCGILKHMSLHSLLQVAAHASRVLQGLKGVSLPIGKAC